MGKKTFQYGDITVHVKNRLGDRYPRKIYKHNYGNLSVAVESHQGSYIVTILRPEDGYEVVIETPERNPLDAGRYAMGLVEAAWMNGTENEILGRAAQEIGSDVHEALKEVEVREDL